MVAREWWEVLETIDPILLILLTVATTRLVLQTDAVAALWAPDGGELTRVTPLGGPS